MISVSQILQTCTLHSVGLFSSPLSTVSMFVYFLVNTKLPPFDQILRKDANYVSNKLLWVLITVVVSTKDMVYIFYLRNYSYCAVFIPSGTKWQNWYLRLRTIYAAKFEQTITHQHVILRLDSKCYWWSICNNDIVFARFNCTSHIRGPLWLNESGSQIT